jgi:hypothetical protein
MFNIYVFNQLSDPPEFIDQPFDSNLVVEVDFKLLPDQQQDVIFISNIATDIDGNDIFMTFEGP